MENFSSKFNWKKNNLKLCRFGLAPLDILQELTATKAECKIKLNWNVAKLAMTIGYNLSPFQNHLNILKQFENEEIQELKDRIQLVIPITYPKNERYKTQILEKLNQLPFEYVFYDAFLDDETIAYIRKASDLMIQLQVTDQFSGSMQEHLFTRNIVITGSWLPYDTIKKRGGWFIEIGNFEDLKAALPDLINNFEKYEQKTAPNPRVVSELSSWEKNIKDWISLYNQ